MYMYFYRYESWYTLSGISDNANLKILWHKKVSLYKYLVYNEIEIRMLCKLSILTIFFFFFQKEKYYTSYNTHFIVLLNIN